MFRFPDCDTGCCVRRPRQRGQEIRRCRNPPPRRPSCSRLPARARPRSRLRNGRRRDFDTAGSSAQGPHDEATGSRSVGEIDVHQPVAVVIEHGHATGHRFDLVLLRGGRVLQMEPYAGSSGDIDKARRRQDLVRSFARDRDRTPLERAPGFPNESMLGSSAAARRACTSASSPRFTRSRNMAYDACGSASGFGRSRVRLHGARECCVCILHPAETDIRVCQSRERRHVGRIESYRTRQRLRRRAEALRILMQSPKQRPRFSIRRIWQRLHARGVRRLHLSPAPQSGSSRAVSVSGCRPAVPTTGVRDPHAPVRNRRPERARARDV